MTVDQTKGSRSKTKLPWSGMQVPRQRPDEPAEPPGTGPDGPAVTPAPPPVFPRLFAGI